jgi:hypothetical protein
VSARNPFSCALGLQLAPVPGGVVTPGDCSVKTKRINQSWDDWDLFQVGGIIFF